MNNDSKPTEEQQRKKRRRRYGWRKGDIHITLPRKQPNA